MATSKDRADANRRLKETGEGMVKTQKDNINYVGNKTKEKTGMSVFVVLIIISSVIWFISIFYNSFNCSFNWKANLFLCIFVPVLLLIELCVSNERFKVGYLISCICLFLCMFITVFGITHAIELSNNCPDNPISDFKSEEVKDIGSFKLYTQWASFMKSLGYKFFENRSDELIKPYHETKLNDWEETKKLRPGGWSFDDIDRCYVFHKKQFNGDYKGLNISQNVNTKCKDLIGLDSINENFIDGIAGEVKPENKYEAFKIRDLSWKRMEVDIADDCKPYVYEGVWFNKGDSKSIKKIIKSFVPPPYLKSTDFE